MDTIRSFYGVIAAGKGVLLGGVKVHTSSRFSTFENALKWMTVSVEANLEAGRDILQAEVAPSILKPEI